ncbi:MAG TPA: competence protein ComEC, partial [Caulobacteraceae bacterium]|nr:competence protein ComEC [Caulobacteraceae bacterium]
PAPDVWIASDGAAAVVRAGREAIPLRDNAKAFAADIWMRRRGLTAREMAGARAYLCNRASCIPAVRAPVEVAASWSKRAPPAKQLALLCHAGEVVTLRARIDALPPACRGKLVLDGLDFARGGSIELWKRDGRWLGQWSVAFRGVRPWTGGAGQASTPNARGAATDTRPG